MYSASSSLGAAIVSVLMLNELGPLSASLWAFVIGNACTIVATMDPHSVKFRQRMDELNYLLYDMNFPEDLQVLCRSRAWLLAAGC